ncbi:1-phosphatidylinositol 4,5-bisphosphate phosphodiesterase zeta-1-like [Latimeria chalumnae]|uniref:1-phosphatidylinositol 4,5-bisphosphate phosphodiesterase zeta-1-like n=1 Tax=Latimeria chalumnae TaxID=7897 RepID=UPI00313EB552
MTFDGFYRFINSPFFDIFNKEHEKVYQDMTQPLQHYFISSSHNTYLLGDQLASDSSTTAYLRVLRKGCRCVEIDCWDGPDGEPIVYHGHTLTSKILFKNVIKIIHKFAFETTKYPVTLSLENHCSPPQQEKMAFYMRNILKETLLDKTVGGAFSRQLPSPEDLIGKILVKNKKIGALQDTILEGDTDRHGQVGEIVETDSDGDDEEELSQMQRLKASWKKMKSNIKNTLKPKKTTIELAMDLSDLVIYTKAVRFQSFEYSRDNQKFYEMNSLGETKAIKLGRQAACDFMVHTSRFLTRIYPKGSRAFSSNYNPQELWNVGCQMVALNFQTGGLQMDLQDGKFRDNGGCGYILKPVFLRRPERYRFNPNNPYQEIHPIKLDILIISANQIVGSDGVTEKEINPYVQVEIWGVPVDCQQKSTYVIKNNGFNPIWNEILSFSIEVPELALVRFTVEHDSPVTNSIVLGQYTLPFTCMKKGYRNVLLNTREGVEFDVGSLFVNISINRA